MIFLEEEFRAFCPTGEGGGIKNDCSASEGGGAATATKSKPGKVDNSWKREQGPVRFTSDELQKAPPAKSLAGVDAVVMLDGELVNKALREVGVTLDQAARACANLSPDARIIVGHGGMPEIVDFVSSDDPERFIEDTVTFTSEMPFGGKSGAVKTAASLTRTEEDGLVMSYSMLMISEEAKAASPVAIARQMMKGTVASIAEAEKIGVDKVEMLAAGSETDENFRGYRIWPRLGFDGVIPRSKITPTWSLMKGFFNSYGSGLPDKMLSPRARKEKAAGALTIQALYETKEGQEWWEKNGGEMEMSLRVGDRKSPGWKRFEALRERFSKRGLDLADAFFDVECRSLLDEAWAEERAYCATGEGGGIDNSCGSSDGPSSTATATKVDDSWKDSAANVSLSGDELKERPPFEGAEKAGSVDLLYPHALKGAMAQVGIESLGDLAAMAGGTVRGSRVKIFGAAGNREVEAFRDAYISVENKIPLARDGSDSEGAFDVSVSVYRDGDEYVLGLNEMYPNDAAKATGERIARATSLMQQAVVESLLGADRAGLSRIEMSAAGGPEYHLKGYRLWPQFGFDAFLEQSHKHVLSKAPAAVVEKVMRAARPDLFATRVPPPHAALVAALPQSEISIQQLISFREGDVWWDKNGTTIGMTLDLSDKKSLGYAKFQKRVSRLKRLKDRNQDRAFFEWLEEEAEFRAGADCGRVEGGRFGPKNDCAGDGSVDSSWLDGEQAYMKADEIAAAPPFKGAHVLEQFNVRDVPALVTALSEDFGSLKSVENIVTIGGGLRNNGKVSIDADSYQIFVETTLPVSQDGSPSLGDIYSAVTILSDDGTLTAQYDEMGLSPEAMSAIEAGDDPESSSERRRIASLVLERMTESLVAVENAGIVRADTIAAGSSTGALRGYRLWPQFGFDGQLTQRQEDRLTDAIEEGDIVLTPEQSERKQAGTLTVQDLIATTDGDRWWNDNGSIINLTLDFTDKSSPGYKRFERMKKMLGRLKERNKSRSAFDEGVEYRKEDCGRVEGGKFAPKNDCASEDGGGTATATKERKPSKKAESTREPLKWSPRDGHIDIFREASQNNPTKKSEDGKKILSTSIPNAKVVRGIAGKDEIEPLDVGNFLLARQAEHRGRVIDTTKALEGDDFEYMVSGIASQVESAVSRGVSPNFYSPEDRKAQVEEYAKIQPLMRGGRTASGFCIGVEGPNGECEPSEGISPQAEFLFRAAQALTSPEANPYENMLRADSVLTAFFEEADPAKAKLGSGIKMAGAGAQNTLTNFSRLQKIVDRVGLEEARRLFAGPSMPVSDFESFFLSKIPGGEGERYEANSYAVAEVVPPFSIFGPKVGPFFANNTGDTEALTADIWFTRTWGRLSGELVSGASPSRAKKHGAELMAATKDIDRKELSRLGLDGRGFRTLVSQMKQKGVIPQQIADWAEARKKQYEKDEFPSPEKGNGTQKRYALDRLAVNIVGNQAGVMSQPKTTVMRSNMIRVMREASKRTGVSVAYMQDILWQDEQDTWGLLGSRTTTVPGVPSLYSDVIRKIVSEPQNLQKRRRESRRSLGDIAEPMELPFYGDQKGGLQQAAYNDFLSGISDDEFADLAIEFLERNARKKQESRSLDCGRNPDGTFAQDNDCGGEGLAFATVGSPSFTAKKGLSAVLRAPEKSIQATLKQSWSSKKYHIAGSIMRNVESRGAEKTSRDVLQLSGYTSGTVSKFAEEIQWQYNDDVDSGTPEHTAASTAAGTLSLLAAAARVYPAAKKEPFVPLTRDMVIDEFVADGMKKEDATAFAGQAAAFYSIRDDKIFVNLGTGTTNLISAAEDDERKSRGELTHLSSTHFGHTIVHEIAHKIHFQHLRSLVGIKSGVSHDSGSPELEALLKAENDARAAAIDYCKDNSLPLSDVATQVSAYATESPSEFVAEYYAGVATGAIARTPLLDGLMAACNFPMNKMPRKKK